jgi:hypothetical protein
VRGRRVHDALTEHYASIVDQHVDRTDFRIHTLSRGIDLFNISDVNLETKDMLVWLPSYR